ncbi:MAG: thiamine phosphate synthase, partial [Peptococcus niger]
MSKLFVVTERKLVAGDFLEHLRRIIAARPHAIILREKDLSFSAYLSLVDQLAPLCESADIHLILNWRDPM